MTELDFVRVIVSLLVLITGMALQQLHKFRLDSQKNCYLGISVNCIFR
jgi:hypothetical protein